MCCRNSCIYLSIIAGIVAGVVLGVLYSLGYVSSGIVFWVYLGIGALAALLAPLYTTRNSYKCGETCFCYYKNLILVAAIGSIIAAAVGLIIAAVASTVAIAVVFGIASFFVVMLIASLICLADCLCAQDD